jgi:hypothetical protein
VQIRRYGTKPLKKSRLIPDVIQNTIVSVRWKFRLFLAGFIEKNFGTTVSFLDRNDIDKRKSEALLERKSEEHKMSIIAWIVVGLVAGVLAKWAMPGGSNEPSGWIGTTLLGIVGAVLGGWIWNAFLGRAGAQGIDIGSIFVAFVGSVILIALLRMFTRRSV